MCDPASGFEQAIIDMSGSKTELLSVDEVQTWLDERKSPLDNFDACLRPLLRNAARRNISVYADMYTALPPEQLSIFAERPINAAKVHLLLHQVALPEEWGCWSRNAYAMMIAYATVVLYREPLVTVCDRFPFCPPSLKRRSRKFPTTNEISERPDGRVGIYQSIAGPARGWDELFSVKPLARRLLNVKPKKITFDYGDSGVGADSDDDDGEGWDEETAEMKKRCDEEREIIEAGRGHRKDTTQLHKVYDISKFSLPK